MLSCGQLVDYIQDNIITGFCEICVVSGIVLEFDDDWIVVVCASNLWRSWTKDVDILMLERDEEQCGLWRNWNMGKFDVRW